MEGKEGGREGGRVGASRPLTFQSVAYPSLPTLSLRPSFPPCRNCWSQPDATEFMVRGLKYMTDKVGREGGREGGRGR